MPPSNQVWTLAVRRVRKELKVTGIVAAGRKTQDGKAICVKAKATLALTIVSTLLPAPGPEAKHHHEKNYSTIASLCSHARSKRDLARERLERLRTLLRA